MNLSQHFFLREFLTSQTAARMGRTLEPTPDVIANLSRLCIHVLEPIRIELGLPISISSGWRPEWLNSEIGGERKSDHITGLAADFNVVGMRDYDAAVRIGSMMNRLPIKQLILEYPPNGWLHVSVSELHVEPRRQILTARRTLGGTVYDFGLQRAA